MFQPLCPDLYNRLVRVFGAVGVASPGEELVAAPRAGLFRIGGGDDDYVDIEVTSPGEYYTVNCPFCSDRRKRLWINHRWAEYPRLAICYNEGCLEKGGLGPLRRMVMLPYRAKALDVRRGTREAATLGPVSPPGPCRPLSALPDDHPARVYVRDTRGFDPDWLTRTFGVGVCDGVFADLHRSMIGRLYVPIMMRGELVGWQGRYAADLNWAATGIHKYHTMSGFAKRLALYNYDSAVQYPVVVVREGVTDVWATGPNAVAAFGHKLSFGQRQLLLRNWADRGGVLVLGLDPEVEVLDTDGIRELRTAFAERFLVARVPAGVDPGALSPEANAFYIAEAAAAAGISLPQTWADVT